MTMAFLYNAQLYANYNSHISYYSNAESNALFCMSEWLYVTRFWRIGKHFKPQLLRIEIANEKKNEHMVFVKPKTIIGSY